MSSLSQPKYRAESISNFDDAKASNAISNLIDIINDNNLNIFYENSESNFKHNIDQLNLKFYLETEKILSPSNKVDQTENQTKLLIILFKQINLYIKEIERLNTVIIQMSKDPQCLKKRMAIISRQKDNFEMKEQIIHSLKNSISTLEKKLSNVISSENEFRNENELLRKELQYYKDKDNSTNSSIFINPSTPNSTSTSKNFNISNQYKRKSKRTFSDHNQTNIKETKLYGQSPNILNTKISHKVNNNKIKIIKAVKKKISHSNSNTKSNTNITMKNIDIADNIDEEYIKSTSPREISKQSFNSSASKNNNNVCSISFNSNTNNHEDSINDLSQIEKLLVEIKEHFNKENENSNNKSKSEQRIVSIDLDEKENVKKGNNEDTPHFKKRISISDYLNGGSS